MGRLRTNAKHLAIATLSAITFRFPILSEAVADYTLFARHPFDENYILSDTVPTSAEIQMARKLRVFASRGEKESTTFAIYNPSNTPLEDVNVTLTQLSNGGNRIMMEDIDIRVIKVIQKRNTYGQISSSPEDMHPEPEVLIPWTDDYRSQDEFDVSIGTSKQWWITVNIRPDTPPGNYTGTIKINPANAPPKNIPIELEVPPVTLIASNEKISGLYYQPPKEFKDCRGYSDGSPDCPIDQRFDYSDLSTLPRYQQIIRSDFELMSQVGLQTTVLRLESPILEWQGDHVEPDLSFLSATLDEAKIAGLANHPIALRVFNYQGAIKRIIKEANPDWNNSEVNEHTKRNFKYLIQSIENMRIEKDLPEIYFYPADEPFHGTEEKHEKSKILLKELTPLIREALPNAKIFTTIHFINWYENETLREEFNEYVDVQVYNQKLDTHGLNEYTTRDIREHLEQSGDLGFMYRNRRLDIPYLHRIDHGLFLWHLPLQRNVPWTYQYITGDPYSDKDVSCTNICRGDWVYAYPNLYNEDKPLPSLRLIGVREGIDDNRYFFTLKKAIEQSSDESKKEEAGGPLNRVKNKLNSVTPCRNYVNTVQGVISPSDIDDWRKEIAQLIVELEQPELPPSANLAFKLKFQGIDQQRSDQTIGLILNQGSQEKYHFDSVDVSSDQNGIYSGTIGVIDPGTYDIYIKAWAHLQKRFADATLEEGGNNQDWSGTPLHAGDANNDNRVDENDLDQLLQDYLTADKPPPDFNLDGRVDIIDFGLLAESYLSGGD